MKKGPSLLFANVSDTKLSVQLSNRKHLFVDNALIDKMENLEFVVNPPKLAERVIDNIVGSCRKHLTVIEDEEGLTNIEVVKKL